MTVVYAVDLGTTYSKCAFVHPNTREVVVLRLRTGGRLSPDGDMERDAPLRSAVALMMDGPAKVAVVGEQARVRVGEEGVRVIEESKAWIGESTEGGVDAPPWRMPEHDWAYMPQDIGAIVLRRIKQIVDSLYPQFPMDRVMITHPQRFEDPRREATRQAGRIAGLNVKGTVTEPDAAAYYFRSQWGQTDGVHIVFDIGGGTLDVSVIRLESHTTTVLGSNGVHVGGRLYDHRVFTNMLERYTSGNRGFSEAYLGSERNRWMQLAEEIKLALCTGQPKVRKKLRCQSETYEGEEVEYTLDAAQFEAMTADLNDQCRDCCEQALKVAKCSWREIGQVVMVGGSSHNPWLRRMLSDISSREPHTSLGAATAIVQGAAMLADKLSARPSVPRIGGEHASLIPDVPDLRSVLPLAVGVKAFDPNRGSDVIVHLVKKNQQLPSTHFARFRTSEDDQTTIPVEIYEGDSTTPELCTLIGTSLLSGLPAGRPAGYPVTVRIDIDLAGQKKVTARDETTGTESIAVIRYDRERVVPDSELTERKRFIQSLVVRG